MDRRTDRWADGRKDGPSDRDAWTNLKIFDRVVESLICIENAKMKKTKSKDNGFIEERGR